MFELNSAELKKWRSQFVTSNSGDKMGMRYAPFVFTEQGVAQLSSVLNSERAITVNIQIIRLFTKMRKILLSHHELLGQLDELRQSMGEYDEKIELIFEYLKQLEQVRQQETDLQERRKIGYKRNNE